MYYHWDNLCCKNLEKICQKLVDKSGSDFVVYRSKLLPKIVCPEETDQTDRRLLLAKLIKNFCQTSLSKLAKVYFCRPQKLIQTYPPVFGKFSQDFYSKNCPDDNTSILIKFINIDHSSNINVL